MAPTLKQRWRLIARRTWLHWTFPIRRQWWKLKCALNKHDWKEAAALDSHGEFDLTRPGRFLMCARPACQVFRGPPSLVHVGKWMETDDFLVLARLDCQRCWGRGYEGRMVMGENTRAHVPCKCIRVQPRYIIRLPGKASAKKTDEVAAPAVKEGQAVS
ncbi:MAG: hypothetical protein V3S55_08335 [Nitrospiraceae bacterium]